MKNKPVLFEQLHIDIMLNEPLTKSERTILNNQLKSKDLESIIQAVIIPTPNLGRKLRIKISK